MSNRTNNNTPQFLIGPESTSYAGDNASNDPAILMDEARLRVRVEDEQNKESVKLAKRLLIALILITVLGIGFYVVLPYYGVRLSPIVPILSFVAILVGTVMSAVEESRELNNQSSSSTSYSDESCHADGCATGMCPGPRPLRMFRDPPKRD